MMGFVVVPPASPNLTYRREEQTCAPIRITKYNRFGSIEVTTPSRQTQMHEMDEEAKHFKQHQSLSTFRMQAETFFQDESLWDDDCLRPTLRALETTFELLNKSAVSLVLPAGNLYPNGEGGIRIEWRSSNDDGKEKYILLSVDAWDDNKDYIYHQEGSIKGELRKDITARLFTQRLNWLTSSTG